MLIDGSGNRIWCQVTAPLDSERARMRVGQVAVPYITCTEPPNVQAGGGACPFRFRCLGCGHQGQDLPAPTREGALAAIR